MIRLLNDLRRWRQLSGETERLLGRNGDLLSRRAELIASAAHTFRDVVALAGNFMKEAASPPQPQEPAARSGSPRRR